MSRLSYLVGLKEVIESREPNFDLTVDYGRDLSFDFNSTLLDGSYVNVCQFTHQVRRNIGRALPMIVLHDDFRKPNNASMIGVDDNGVYVSSIFPQCDASPVDLFEKVWAIRIHFGNRLDHRRNSADLRVSDVGTHGISYGREVVKLDRYIYAGSDVSATLRISVRVDLSGKFRLYNSGKHPLVFRFWCLPV